MSLKLLTFPALAKSQKVIITAEYAGVALEVDTNVTQEQLAGLSVHGKVPVLVTPEGNLSESNAIARFVARKAAAGNTVYGRNAFETAQVDAWVDFCSNEIEVPATLWIAPILGWMDNNEVVTARAVEDLKKALAFLNNYLASETFLVGRQVTLADIAVATTLLLPFKLVLDENARKPFPHVERWFKTCVNQQQFVDVVGAVQLCEKALVAPKGAAPAAAAAAPKADKPKKEEKPKAAAAPAKEQPKPAAAAKRTQEDRDEEEPAAAMEEKKPNPLDALPKSSFVLDTWKRVYSNAKDCYAVMDKGNDFGPGFFESFDAAGWSVWFATYKYDEENTVGFKTSNLVGGFIQKSEEMRKYMFMVVQIAGTSSQQYIRGAALVRGQDIKPLIDANEMAENFEWVKMNVPPSEEEKKKLAELWCDGDNITVNGTKMPILDCKVFK